MENKIINFNNFITLKKYAYDTGLKQWYAFEINHTHVWSPIPELKIKQEIFTYCRTIEKRYYTPEEINKYLEELKIKLKREMSQYLVNSSGVVHNTKFEVFGGLQNVTSDSNVVWYSPYFVFYVSKRSI